MIHSVNTMALGYPLDGFHGLQSRPEAVVDKAHHDRLCLVICMVAQQQCLDALVSACRSQRLIPERTCFGFESPAVFGIEALRPSERDNGGLEPHYL